MNREQYLKQREEMVNELEGMVAAGISDLDFTNKKKAIEDLDLKFENAAKQQANLNALKEHENVNLQNISAKEAGTILNMGQTTNILEPQISKEEMQNIAFGKAVMGKPLNELEMQNVEYAADNQVVIPTTLLNEIIGDLSTLNPFFGDVRKFNVKGVLTLPKHVRIVSGDAKFENEKDEKVAQDNEFATVTLGAKEISKLIEVSFQLEAMSIPAFIQFLRKEIVDRVSTVIGEAVFTGEGGAASFEGIVTALADTPQTMTYTAGGLTYKNLTSALASIDSKALSGVAIYANSTTVWNEIANLVDGNGRPYFVADVIGGGVGRIFGHVVKVDDGAPTGAIVIANASRAYAVNTNESLSVQSDKDLKRRVNQYLAYTLMDGAVTDEKAAVVLTTTVDETP